MTSELGAEARALIDQACSEEALPDSRELARIRNNVVSGAVSSAVLLAAPHAAGFASNVTPLALALAALKGAALGTVVALGSFSLDRFVLHPAQTPPDTAAERATTAPSPAAPVRAESAPSVALEATAPVPEIAAPRTPSHGKSARETGANQDDEAASQRSEAAPGSLEVSADLREETALLRRVQQELRAGRGAEALRLLDASSRRLERGQLRQERLAAEVLAACQTGNVERARRGARAFLEENSATPSAARLRSSCVGSEFFGK